MEIVSNLKAASERLLCVVDSHGQLSATTYCPSIYYDGHKHRILQRNSFLWSSRDVVLERHYSTVFEFSVFGQEACCKKNTAAADLFATCE